MAMNNLVVIAIGGNSLIKDPAHQEVSDQLAAVRETAAHIADVVAEGWNVVVTHGNGPQVGFILRRSEIAFESQELHFVPLKNCVADTQGALGYQIQESLDNAFRRRGIPKTAVTVVTQVVVDGADPSFANPTKPIGAAYDGSKVRALARQHPDWRFADDSVKGCRRVVPSPVPQRIVELDVVRSLVDAGYCVIAGGGGGIPVVVDAAGDINGVDAVVDKDLTSSLLAVGLGARLLVISTDVERVCLNYRRPDERPIDRMSLGDARRYMDEGHFGQGSMRPKIQAAIQFLEAGGRRSIITNPENLKPAIGNATGTHVVA